MQHWPSCRLLSVLTLLLVFQLAIAAGICLEIPRSGTLSGSTAVHDEHDSQRNSDCCDIHVLSVAAIAADTDAFHSPYQLAIQAAAALTDETPGGIAVRARRPWSQLIAPPSLIVLFGRLRN